MDSHRRLDISHPLWYRYIDGSKVCPFTLVSVERNGLFGTQINADGSLGAKKEMMTSVPGAYARTVEYEKSLATNARFPHIIWPEHCIIGTPGNNIVPPIMDAVHRWEEKNLAVADYVTKGSNPWTEHYSIFQADVPDPSDPGTQLNVKLIEDLEQADDMLLTGEALSHCVANSGNDLGNSFGDAGINKIVLLIDTTSNVTGFEAQGKKFVDDMVRRGMRIAKSTDYQPI
jgi:nicotinamidase-related amidase